MKKGKPPHTPQTPEPKKLKEPEELEEKNGWYVEDNLDCYYINGVLKFKQPVKRC